MAEKVILLSIKNMLIKSLMELNAQNTGYIPQKINTLTQTIMYVSSESGHKSKKVTQQWTMVSLC
ncbi:MAG: hypothetical protein BBJ57_12785 [Desulfobacterales bacterium PC51MH44]|nr:MAG: hypothetical protein BBJ57_12785 [Desulfobacterales bacterium PC51MH44]